MAESNFQAAPTPLTEAQLARHYRWLNLHPFKDMDAIRAWLTTSQEKFQAHQQVYPLVLQGEPSSGRSYLLEAAFFQRNYQHLPVVVFHWDMEVWDAPSQAAQVEHLQARLDNYVQQIQLNNPSLYAKVGELARQVDSVAVPAGVELSVKLDKLWDWLFPPPRTLSAATDPQDTFAPVKARFRQLLQDSHVILHLRHAELLDQGLLAHLWSMVKWLNAEQQADQGLIALAFSFPSNHPVSELLGARERYANRMVQDFSKQRVSQALKDTYGASVATHASVQWLLQHAALSSGKLDANTVSQLLNTLLDQGLLNYDAEQQHWYLSAMTDLESWQKALGAKLEQRWNNCLDQVPSAWHPRLQALFSLAALGGEWIPLDLLLKYLGIVDNAERDVLIDLLDEHFADFLHCANYQFVGIQGLVYLFKSPLIPSLLIDPATRQTQASELIKWLQKQAWGATGQRNQASYLLRLAEYADRELAQQLRQQLAWQVEAEFAADLEAHVLERLLSGDLSLVTLSRLMWNNYSIWPMPRQRAICQAWLAYYQQQSSEANEDGYSGADWDELWNTTQDSPIPATKEGLDLCYFYGNTQFLFGYNDKARALFQLGLVLCEKYKSIGMEARFYSILAKVEHNQGNLTLAETYLTELVIPKFQQLSHHQSLAVAYGRLADILQSRGQLDKALDIYKMLELPVYEQLGAMREKALTMERIAAILQARGQVDEALRIYQDHALPIYEQLGAVRDKAVTLESIAAILQAHGQADEALCIYQTEALPVYEQLGAVRDKAITMARIAAILQARGQVDEALRIYQDHALPIYEQLGAVRDKAVTMARIAAILQARGQVDEALRIYQTDVLPVYEQLGAVHEKALTMGIIATILKDRGQLNEALHIYQDDVLPVYEQLGAVRDKAITQVNIARVLWAQDPIKHRAQVHELLSEAKETSLSMKSPEADIAQDYLIDYGLVGDGGAAKPISEQAKTVLHRNSLCLCGSGKRYKHCCGAL
jgi:tetratricopeptide (TPR) repeat protein